MREQARVDVNAATASEQDGQIKNLPLLYLYAVEQREEVLKLRASIFEAMKGIKTGDYRAIHRALEATE